jgi:hypothetical protein
MDERRRGVREMEREAKRRQAEGFLLLPSFCFLVLSCGKQNEH